MTDQALSLNEVFGPFIGAVGRFSMAESVARQVGCSLVEAAELLERYVDPVGEVTYQSMIDYTTSAVMSSEAQKWIRDHTPGAYLEDEQYGEH